MKLERAERIDDWKPAAAALDLLDEYWFFTNPFNDDERRKEADVERQLQARDDHQVPASLHRMPTLPPRLQRSETVQEEAIRSSLNSCNPKLRHSLTSLDAYRSPSSKNDVSSRQPKFVKLERSERYLAIQHYIAKEAYYRKIFKEKKWRSHSDLECIEVQGFKDLGFVFDEEELKASLANVIPGLRESPGNGETTTGPYLSEAWRVQKTSPPMFGCVDQRSTEDMKEQLKFWARAVACNARIEF